MGASKADLFTGRQNQLAIMMKALGHPARIAIIDMLLKTESCICGDIVDKLPLAQPTISQHLKELKNAGIIKGSIEGNSICYCVDEKAMEILGTYFTAISQKLKMQKNCC
jgi:ArsR family transcriptional regulator, arsenate/arsenite/antimonite-responsive transcriptional repressor